MQEDESDIEASATPSHGGDISGGPLACIYVAINAKMLELIARETTSQTIPVKRVYQIIIKDEKFLLLYLALQLGSSASIYSFPLD